METLKKACSMMVWLAFIRLRWTLINVAWFVNFVNHLKVVKTDDRGVARELGIATFPALVYFRRKNPITYDGKFICLFTKEKLLYNSII